MIGDKNKTIIGHNSLMELHNFVFLFALLAIATVVSINYFEWVHMLLTAQFVQLPVSLTERATRNFAEAVEHLKLYNRPFWQNRSCFCCLMTMFKSISKPVVLNLFDLVAYPRPIKKQTGALCMGSQNNMLN